MTNDVILVDPAWDFKTYSQRGAGRSPSAKYTTTSVKDMTRLDVASISAKNCALFMWTVDWLPPRVAQELGEAWGFTYKTRAWVWLKMNPTGWGFFTGKGYYTRANPEDCLLFVKGRMPVPPSLRPSSFMLEPPHADDMIINEPDSQIIYTPVQFHSRKPDDQYNRIDFMYPPDKYPNRAELFARRRWPGWLAWGNELPGGNDIELKTKDIDNDNPKSS